MFENAVDLDTGVVFARLVSAFVCSRIHGSGFAVSDQSRPSFRIRRFGQPRAVGLAGRREAAQVPRVQSALQMAPARSQSDSANGVVRGLAAVLHDPLPASEAINDSNDAKSTSRRRPIFAVFTRPPLTSNHIVVRPTPMILHAAAIDTARGLGASGAGRGALDLGFIRSAFRSAQKLRGGRRRLWVVFAGDAIYRLALFVDYYRQFSRFPSPTRPVPAPGEWW
jgi:hypothetical protein